MKRKILRDEEAELIELLETYRKAYPRGNWFLELEIDELVERLKDPNY